MPKPPRSPLAPRSFPLLAPVSGVRLATISAGVRYRKRRDLLLVEVAPGTSVAGVLTRSKTASSAVDWCRAALKGGDARALLVTAGNANAFTGRAGTEATAAAAAAAARHIGCRPREVMVAATGVIGEPLDTAPITAALARLTRALKPGGWRQAAEAIRTTDTFAKGAGARARIAGQPVNIIGIAKGSGMIAPDMATMLAFLFTDASLPAPVLRHLLARANERTFNAITVDGDTSTSDTVLLFATGRRARAAGITRANDPRLADFARALEAVMADLARQIVRDGEGATKFVEITVSGAESARAARRIALSIANSPLVKTAIAGGDPNWGRIVMAVGKSGEAAERDRLAIRIGAWPVAAGGAVRPDYVEAPVARYMRGDQIAIAVDVGVGRGRATVWTCDLTHGYIAINADYRS